MIFARCPHCGTTFRAEPEALKKRAGKVRCGKCHQVFNALDHLVAETSALPTTPAEPPAFALTPPPSAADDAAPAPAAEPAAAPTVAESATTPAPEADRLPANDAAPDDETVAITPHDETTETADDAGTAEAAEAAAAETGEAGPTADPLLDEIDSGQIAVRETREAAGYSKWAEGTLSSPIGNFAEPHHTGWLAVVTAVILGLMLLVQAVHYWRMEIAMQWPETRPWLEEACRSANCTVPYPRDASQINLEASELQIDPERGNMLVLNMTLKNRAPFAQEFPAIELTLTDARENVVVRRILAPAEWLPDLDRNASKADSSAVSTPPAFPAQKEIAARLWIDAQDTGAVGYRLYVFYP